MIWWALSTICCICSTASCSFSASCMTAIRICFSFCAISSNFFGFAIIFCTLDSTNVVEVDRTGLEQAHGAYDSKRTEEERHHSRALQAAFLNQRLHRECREEQQVRGTGRDP